MKKLSETSLVGPKKFQWCNIVFIFELVEGVSNETDYLEKEPNIGVQKNGYPCLPPLRLLFVVQILQVSGGDVGVGRGTEIQGIRVKMGEGKWRRSQRTLREEDHDKPKPHF